MASHTGTADLPLHDGKAPAWLFERMARLAPAIVEALVIERGPAFVLERLSDPARFSFAHGGKDGTPFPVDRKTYDQSVEWLRQAVEQARVGRTDGLHALKRLSAVRAPAPAIDAG